ncbi:hypothetical protein AE372_003615 [Salmonella enterica subsp. enterica serovar Colindale]|nr:hypothetical protein [Salmonella enterica subsp. enterica serovar Colindale]
MPTLMGCAPLVTTPAWFFMQNPVIVGVKKPTGEVGFLHPEPELVALTGEELSLSNG